MNLRTRLEKLEATQTPPVAYVWQKEGETAADAIQRWRALHPCANARPMCIGWLPSTAERA